jgi:hypothetical protein
VAQRLPRSVTASQIRSSIVIGHVPYVTTAYQFQDLSHLSATPANDAFLERQPIRIPALFRSKQPARALATVGFQKFVVFDTVPFVERFSRTAGASLGARSRDGGQNPY